VNKSKLGKWGEETAVHFLEQKGYEILEKRFRGGGGEVDIIAREGENFVFVEVKTRRYLDMESMERVLNKIKRSRIEQACLAYLNQNNLNPELTQLRFDCIFISGESILHLVGAWEKDG